MREMNLTYPVNPRAGRGRARALYRTVVLLGLLSAFSLIPAHADVELPAGRYHESTDDLTVTTVGGIVTLKRTWYDKAWHLNRAWNPLKLTYDSLDGSLKSIERNGDVYKKTNAEGTLFRFDARLTITMT